MAFDAIGRRRSHDGMADARHYHAIEPARRGPSALNDTRRVESTQMRCPYPLRRRVRRPAARRRPGTRADEATPASRTKQRRQTPTTLRADSTL